jgi:hypothetical protein
MWQNVAKCGIFYELYGVAADSGDRYEKLTEWSGSWSTCEGSGGCDRLVVRGANYTLRPGATAAAKCGSPFAAG